MKKYCLLSILAISAVLVISSCGKEEPVIKTDTISFEEILLNEDGYNNGSDGSGGFTIGNAIFKTSFNSDWGSWSGFAVSNHIDTITQDYSNQYSSIAGSGAGKSEKYVILYSSFAANYKDAADTIGFVHPALITNIAISNSAYAYYTMKEGNQFSKKFGGALGNDPDYFYLYLSVVNDKGIRRNMNPIPLADFTFDDNSLDYISKEWEYYDLSDAGYIKYLIFSFDSSDKTESYLNTPTYVCIDNIVDKYKE